MSRLKSVHTQSCILMLPIGSAIVGTLLNLYSLRENQQRIVLGAFNVSFVLIEVWFQCYIYVVDGANL